MTRKSAYGGGVTGQSGQEQADWSMLATGSLSAMWVRWASSWTKLVIGSLSIMFAWWTETDMDPINVGPGTDARL